MSATTAMNQSSLASIGAVAMAPQTQSLRWHVIVTSGHRGAASRAERHLRDQDFQIFSPLALVDGPDRGGRHEPMFGPYRFVLFDPLNPSWSAICHTPGVSRLLRRVDGRPEPVKRGFVESLLATVSASQVLDLRTKPETINTGDTVRVRLGPDWHDATVLWSSDDRVRVLMSVLGRRVPVSVARDDLRRAVS